MEKKENKWVEEIRTKTSYVVNPLIKKDSVEARSYQLEISKSVMEKGNTLVVAPTALGKTIVALLTVVQVLEKNPDKKIMFLAPTKPLAMQHQKSFQKLMTIEEEKIELLTGTVSPEKRKKIFEDAKIIIATPQTIENDLIQSKINLKKMGLVIFDESHRAVGDYSYVFVAEKLMKENPEARILATTASPGSEKEKIEEVCKNLFIKNLEIKNYNDDDVKAYIKENKVEWKMVELPEEYKEIKKHIQNYTTEQINALKKMGLSPTANIKYFNKTRLLELQSVVRKRIITSGSNQPSLFSAISKIAALMKVSHAETMLETQGIEALQHYFQKIEKESQKAKSSKALKSIFANIEMQKAMNLTNQAYNKKISHPKIEELKKELTKQIEKNPKSKIIIFNHYRDNINTVLHEIKELNGIKAQRFVGQAKKGNEKGLSQKEQKEIIEKLRNDEFNVLVASSVAEEGLDIPSVELVIFYEPVPSEIRTIQRRGRTGRLEDGKTVMLIAKNTRDEAYYYTARAKEKNMQKTLSAIDISNQKQTKIFDLFDYGETREETQIETPEEMQEKTNEKIQEENQKNNKNENEIEKKDDFLKQSNSKINMNSKINADSKINPDSKETEFTDYEKINHQNAKQNEIKDLEKTEKKNFNTGQETLFQYIKNKEEIVIFADTREQASKIIKELTKKEAKIIVKQLDVGDFIVSNEIVIERKTIEDFLTSITDGRLFNQLINMSNNYEKPVLLLEGNIDEIYTLREIHKNAIMGIISSIATTYRIPIINTKDIYESADYIYHIAKREQEKNEKPIKIRIGKKGLTPEEQQQYILEGFPMIGPQMAKTLLNKFGTIKNIMNTTEKELIQLPNMGEIKAKKLLKLLNHKWDKNKTDL